VSSAVPARVRALSFHSRYRCCDSGACCSSGWDIPVEGGRSRVAAHDSTRRTADGRLVLRHDAAGRCVFLEGPPGSTRCAVHRQLGPEALPSACRQFPRVTLLTPLGVSVTLSHYCPTAAALLFEAPERPTRIVEDAPAFPPDWPYEGLDARSALPPLLRPGVLMSWAAHDRWETHVVATLTGSRAPGQALARLAAEAETARRWAPPDGGFDRWFDAVLDASDLREAPLPVVADLEAWDLVAATVPEGNPRPPRPGVAAGAEAVPAGWAALRRPIGRWLASKAFASWLALQGDGLRTTVLGLQVALAVLRAEAVGACLRAGRPLDAALLEGAVRRSDLLLLHLADPSTLAARLGRCERTEQPATRPA